MPNFAFPADRLTSMLLVKSPVSLVGTVGTVEAIEIEDGSRKSFNVRMRKLDGEVVTVYVRTM